MSTGIAERKRRAIISRPESGTADSVRDSHLETVWTHHRDYNGALTVENIANTFYRTYGKYPDVTLDSAHDGYCSGDILKPDGSYHPVLEAAVRKGGSNNALKPIIKHVWEECGRPGRGIQASLCAGDLHLLENVILSLGDKPTPFIAFDVTRLRSNYSLIKGMLDSVEVFYPVKTNDQHKILSLLRRWGSGFEAASWGEIELLLEFGTDPGDIIYGAPVKSIDHIRAAYEAGIRVYAYDSIEEVPKLARAAPASSVYLRLSTIDNGDSVFPLSEKFGVQPCDAVSLLVAAARSGLHPCGLSFHVGSQCLNPKSWWIAIASSARVWNEAARVGIKLSFLNLGGGIPISYCDPVLDKEIFISHLNLALKSHFHKRPRLIIEPGRSMVGDIAVMAVTVIGKARRDQTDWLYIDAGIYQGLVEAAQEKDRFRYLVFAEGEGGKKEYTIGGPTCDSGDIVIRGAMLPEVNCGDRLYILNAGAYTNVCATNFNGFRMPDIYFIDDEGGDCSC